VIGVFDPHRVARVRDDRIVEVWVHPFDLAGLEAFYS
jgi:hypothetical protein